MYDVNPLGPMMHLRELERQSARRLRLVRPRRQNDFGLTAFKSLIIAFTQRAYTACFR